MEPARELGMYQSGYPLMWILTLIALILAGYGFCRRYQLWRIGRPENRNDRVEERLVRVIKETFGHRKLLQSSYPGRMHWLIFWGFTVLFIGTLLTAAQEDLGLKILEGRFYLIFSLAMDLAGVAALVGVGLAAYRRYVLKPEALDNQREDGIILLLIGAIMATGFLLEGVRIAGTGDPWAAWSPVGASLAGLFPWVTVPGGLHQGLWWIHLLLSLGFIAYLPYSKLLHMVSVPLNQYLAPIGPVGVLKPVDFDDEENEDFGVAKVEEFTWKQLLDTDACTRCGRCQDNCPAHLSGKPLSPKNLTQELKAALVEKGRLVQGTQTNAGGRGVSGEAAAGDEETNDALNKQFLGDVVDHETVWACTTCRSCEEQCPAMVEHLAKVIEMRRNLVLSESVFPAEAQLAFRNMENNGNPWAIGWAARADWAQELEVPTMAEAGEVEYLYWVGCAGSFDGRNKKVSEAVVTLLKQARVSFAILGNEEKCCGDSARRLGNEYLYQTLAEENISTMKEYGVKKVITHCPHCFNIFKNEYPQLGGDFQVIHHTQLLASLVVEGRVKPRAELAQKVAYHDSCYLGRYNEVYEPPRELLKAIPGICLTEMERHREKSFCCGAGGGRMWLEETIGERINVMRTTQALESEPNLLVTACPFCLTMLVDGVKSQEATDRVKVLDIAEVLEQVI
ncbi:MAG: heterodisulfide reductase-related iron-sulfur binding cluster [Thermincolia bacterium]